MDDSTLLVLDSCGIVEETERRFVARVLESYVRHREPDRDKAARHMVQRWNEYCDAVSSLRFSYGSAARFFAAGMWDKPQAWPWERIRDVGPDPCVGMYRPEKIM